MKLSYDSQSSYSDPMAFGALIHSWPTEPKYLSKSIAEFIFHIGSDECQNVPTPDDHQADMQIRTVFEVLERITNKNNNSANRKFAGVCRDFSLLAASSFRSHGIPARLRVGFADYFNEGFYDDHWLCEVYDGQRWNLLDLEVLAEPSIAIALFDAAAVQSDRFLNASKSWHLVQYGKLSGSNFGVHRLNITGDWIVAANVFRDAAALCSWN